MITSVATLNTAISVFIFFDVCCDVFKAISANTPEATVSRA